jgi:hypothetical protein
VQLSLRRVVAPTAHARKDHMPMTGVSSVAPEGDRVFFRAGWLARDDDRDALVEGVSDLLRLVEEVAPEVSRWELPGVQSRRDGAGIAPDEITRLFQVRQSGGGPCRFDLSLRAVGKSIGDFSVNAGPSGSQNFQSRAVLWLSSGVLGESKSVGASNSRLFDGLIDIWRPDWASVYPEEMGRSQFPDSNGFVVGLLTYVRAELKDFRTPVGCNLTAGPSGSVLDLRGLGDAEMAASARVLRSGLERSAAAHLIGVRAPGFMSEHEAYLVMVDYLASYAARGGSDLRDLLGDMEPAPDGESNDPAVWPDWIESVDRIRDGRTPGSSAAF